MTQLVWLITGCSSGIGESLAKAVLARGDKVIATARAPVSRLKSLEDAGAAVLELDVTDPPEKLDKAIETALAVYGSIDVLVPNAGYGEMVVLEETSQEIWKKQLDVNFYGVVNLVTAVLPHFRSRKSGTIAFMNSVYAHTTSPLGGPYTVSKHAIAGYSKTLVKEVGPFGIRPIIFDIGFIRTPFAGNMKVYPPKIEDYAPGFDIFATMGKDIPGNQPGDPEQCVGRIIDVVKSEGLAAGKPTPALVPLGTDAYLTIRKYAESVLKLCDEWESLSKSVSYDEPRRGFFEHVEHYCF